MNQARGKIKTRYRNRRFVLGLLRRRLWSNLRQRAVTVFLLLVLAAGLVLVFPNKTKAISTVGTSSSVDATTSPEQRKVIQSTNGTFVTVYNAGTETPLGLTYRTSTDNGATWSSGTQIDSASTNDSSLAIDASDNIYVTFADSGALKSRKLTYSGGSWSVGAAVTIASPTTCVANTTNGISYSVPTIAADGSGKAWVNATKNTINSTGCSASLSKVVETWNSATGSAWTKNAASLAQVTTVTRGSPIVSTGKDLWSIFPTNSGDREIYVDRGGSGVWTLVVTPSFTLSGNDGLSMTYGLDEIHFTLKHTISGLQYYKYSLSTNTLSTATSISTDTNDGFASVTTDTYNIWVVYTDFVAASSYNVVYKRFNGTAWDSAATAITTDNLNNVAVATPYRLRNTINLPVIWTVGTASPFTVKSHVFSSLGTATDSGNQSSAFTGSLTGSTGDQLVKSGEWYYDQINVVAGMTVRVVASDGVIGGSLTLRGNTASVAGSIDGSGRGNAGGAGLFGVAGTGGIGGTAPLGDGGAGTVGTSIAGSLGAGSFGGSSGGAGTNASDAGLAGGGGGIGGGGGGGTSSAGTAGGSGGYLSAGGNGDTSVDESLALGSGGGSGGSGGSGAGGGGGGGGDATGGAGGAGGKGGYGGKGGNGGASIKIYSAGSITIGGSIVSTGQTGSSAGAGNAGITGDPGVDACGALC